MESGYLSDEYISAPLPKKSASQPAFGDFLHPPFLPHSASLLETAGKSYAQMVYPWGSSKPFLAAGNNRGCF